MFELIFKIWYLIAIFPVLIILDGWEMFKKYMGRKGYKVDLAFTLLFILIIALITVLLLQYGYK